MKKTVVIIFIAVILCSSHYGCALKQNVVDGPKSSLPPGSIVYGTFSDCYVWFTGGQLDYIDVKTVAGYKFIYTSGFTINVEKNGEVYNLQNAYENGLLTKEDIAEIYLIHKNHVIETVNIGEELYKEYEGNN